MSQFPESRPILPDEIFGKDSRLKSPPKGGFYKPPEEIARVLRENPGVPLPPAFHAYVCDHLEGKVRAPAGRPVNIKNPVLYFNRILIPSTYARYHAWLKKRKRSIGLDGWKPIRDAHWWQGPPSERAARMTCHGLRLAMSWRRVQNIVSEAKR